MVPLRNLVSLIANQMQISGLSPQDLDLICGGLERSTKRSWVEPSVLAAVCVAGPPDPSLRSERIGAVMHTILPSPDDDHIILSRPAQEMPRLDLTLLSQVTPELRRQELCDLFAVALNAMQAESAS
jgi:hypothetical protein